MLTSNELLSRIIEQYSSNIQCILKGGSLGNPFIKNPRDTNYIIVMRPEVNDEIVAEIRQLRRQCHEKGINVFVRRRSLVDETIVTPYSYCDRWAEMIYGQCDFWDLFQHRNEYLDMAARYLSDNSTSKSLYHIITALFFLQHGSYFLTPEEVEIVNQVHNKNPEIYAYWLNWASETLRNWSGR